MKEYFPAYHKADGTLVKAVNGEDTAIETLNDDCGIVDTRHYGIDGVERRNNAKGFSIKVEKRANGNVIVTKSIK